MEYVKFFSSSIDFIPFFKSATYDLSGITGMNYYALMPLKIIVKWLFFYSKNLKLISQFFLVNK